MKAHNSTAIKNTIFMEANLTDILQSFSFIPHMASEEMILFFFFLLFFCFVFLLLFFFCCFFFFVCGNSEVWIKIICLVEDYSRDFSVKLLSKYLQ